MALDGEYLYLSCYSHTQSRTVSFNGHVRRGLACVSTVTAECLPWNPQPEGGSGGVWGIFSVVVRDSKVYAGGGFDTIGGQSRSALAVLETAENNATGQALEWNPRLNTPTSECIVESITFGDDDSLYAVGRVTNNFSGMSTCGLVAAFPVIPEIDAAVLDGATEGVPCTFQLQGRDASTPEWSISDGSLPGGLAIDPATGEISGTPDVGTGNQAYMFEVTLADLAASAPAPYNAFSRTFAIFVDGPAASLPYASTFNAGESPAGFTSGGRARATLTTAAAAGGTGYGLQLDVLPGSPIWPLQSGAAAPGQAAADDPARWTADAPEFTGSLEWSVDAAGLSEVHVSFDWMAVTGGQSWYANMVVEIDDGTGWRAGWGSTATLTGANVGVYRATIGASSFRNETIAFQNLTPAADLRLRLRWLSKWSMDEALASGICVDNLRVQDSPVVLVPAIDVREAVSGVPIAAGSVASGSRDFGAALTGTLAGTPLTIRVTNTGTADLILAVPQLLGLGASSFVLDTAGFLTTLGAGAQTSFTAAFCPVAAGQAIAVISLTHSAPGGASPYVFDITGLGVDALSITTPVTLPAGVAGQAYGRPLTMSGGIGPFAWQAAGLPAGWTLSVSGALAAIAPGEGLFTFTVTVTDGSALPQQASQTFSVEIGPAEGPAGNASQALPGASAGCAMCAETTRAATILMYLLALATLGSARRMRVRLFR